MARAKRVPGDQGSQEFDHLRKTVHTILMLLEKLSTANSADAAALLASANAIGDAVTNGVTSSSDAVVPNREVLGVLPAVKTHQMVPTSTSTVVLNSSDKNY
jgi:hypothetical protein